MTFCGRVLRAVGAERPYITDQNDAKEAAVSDIDWIKPGAEVVVWRDTYGSTTQEPTLTKVARVAKQSFTVEGIEERIQFAGLESKRFGSTYSGWRYRVEHPDSDRARQLFDRARRERAMSRALAAVSHRREPLPTHAFAGSDSERQSVGDPGHCEACARYGHVAAHPTWGCAEAGCTREHGPDEVADRLGALRVPADRAAEDTTASTCSCPEHTRHPAWSRRACYRREHPLPGDLDQHAALLRAADLARKP